MRISDWSSDVCSSDLLEDSSKMGLVVDEIVGQQQVVIKSLEENFDPIRGVGAATILGNGRVSLILDVAGIKHIAEHDTQRPNLQARALAAPALQASA